MEIPSNFFPEIPLRRFLSDVFPGWLLSLIIIWFMDRFQGLNWFMVSAKPAYTLYAMGAALVVSPAVGGCIPRERPPPPPPVAGG